jgi:type IX secretion system PorP/SprF family membrane protein
MKKTIKYYITLIFINSFFSCYLHGQQYDPLNTQYMFNSLAINPAYAGTSGSLSAMLMTRHQWIGYEDAPNTQTFSLHSPITSRNIGVGFSLIYDKIGPIANTNFSFDYSNNFKISEQIKISLGLKGTLSNFHRDFSKFYKEVGNDPAYYDIPEQKVLPNFGFGVYCYNDRFYAGAAVPRLLENIINDDSSVSSVTNKENRLYMLMAGGVFAINPSIMLKPSFILRASRATPLSYDLNLNLLMVERFWVGVMFRPTEAFGALFQMQITNQIRAGYAFELTISKLRPNQFGTHEIMICYDFVFKKDNVLNPRYF